MASRHGNHFSVASVHEGPVGVSMRGCALPTAGRWPRLCHPSEVMTVLCEAKLRLDSPANGYASGKTLK